MIVVKIGSGCFDWLRFNAIRIISA